jgi:outer membrane receptor protein involved in Fe transport
MPASQGAVAPIVAVDQRRLRRARCRPMRWRDHVAELPGRRQQPARQSRTSRHVPAAGYRGLPVVTVQENFEYDTQSWSAFGQLDFNLTDRFTLTVGGRYTEEEKEMATHSHHQ